ncbi:hypothetical protein AA984_01680 [Brevibacillus formosus]|uniref:Uncharacterized protein n=1 Tax=Brevibacillus formosus TaxID=54913 RepID=A0A837KUT3_9BACL|nr:hypothetical protein AA984_01680 [Brevibacillus formosus]PSJ92648.1 hypothetical protein C7R91_24050 [Brevibacillus formosus]GED58047.1 hypothetical protein BFO01nite_21790 [Brevibacillus formosus]
MRKEPQTQAMQIEELCKGDITASGKFGHVIKLLLVMSNRSKKLNQQGIYDKKRLFPSHIHGIWDSFLGTTLSRVSDHKNMNFI